MGMQMPAAQTQQQMFQPQQPPQMIPDTQRMQVQQTQLDLALAGLIARPTHHVQQPMEAQVEQAQQEPPKCPSYEPLVPQLPRVADWQAEKTNSPPPPSRTPDY